MFVPDSYRDRVKIAVFGTFNLNSRSENLNTECIAIAHSEKLAKEVLACMEEEFNPKYAIEFLLGL